MWLAIAVGSAVLFGLAGWWMKVSQMRRGHASVMLFGLYATGTAGFGIHAAVEGSFRELSDYRVWLAGIIIGAGSALGNALFMKALDYGPAALTSPLTNMNIVLVIALGTLYYGESLHATEATGIVLLLAAVVMISYKKQSTSTSVQSGWYLYVTAAILFFTFRNGGLKVTEELGISSAPVLFIGYALSLIWFAFPLRKAIDHAAFRTGLKLGLLAGVFSYGGLQLYAVALATGPSNLAAPIFATNSLVVAAGSILIYQEKLNRVQWAAFALTIAGLVIIRI
ncbi:DMT family transporter [Paenibacillus glycanilyticus]|uniref:DMT family transporter n=1 Tax=Paenibacillus glycanilyticus TaxID=126569 RepID=UPI00203C10DD|nr:DMT family transporter [Paenibacillus glycanilyticus]MCM3629234.1 DMT family transporter [Paenibacillus glycanilyticus]